MSKQDLCRTEVSQILKNSDNLRNFFQQKINTSVFLNDLVIYFVDFIDTNSFLQSYQDFLCNRKENDPSNIQFFNIIYHLLDQNLIQEKFTNLMNKLGYNCFDENFVFRLMDLHFESSSFYEFSVDEKCNFYYQKIYLDIENEIAKQEVEIFHTDFSNEYPSFIVHSNKELEGKKMMIPYFPFETLRTFLDLVQNEHTNILFTSIDKFVIIKEISIGLQQLHSKSIYHQNLQSSFIMINNNKDSFISTFYFDIEHEKQLACLDKSFYYRHPDLIPNSVSLSYKEDLEKEEKERYAKHDIYSLGVLIYEIVTTTSPDKFFINMIKRSRYDIMLNDYRKFLFSKYDNDGIDFDSKYGIQGIRKIIEKCMETKEPNTYSSMEEIISDLDKLPIHQNKEKIDNKINNAANSNQKECTLCDIVINYYLGNSKSQILIESLYKYFNHLFSEEILLFDIIDQKQEDIISKIFNVFGFINFNFTKNRISSMLKSHYKLQICFEHIVKDKVDPNILISFYENLLSHFLEYTNNQPLIKSFKKFINDENESDYSTLKKKVAEKINVHINHQQISRIFELFSIVIAQLLDKNKIREKLAQIIQYTNNESDNNKNQIYNLKDLSYNGNFDSEFKFSFDEKCNFYYQKIYNNINEELIKQEVEIYHTDFSNEYPSFIVHSNKELEGNKMMIPYFPFETLRTFLDLVQNEQTNILFTSIDKFIIIKEISIGLQQLHSKSIYHQNLQSSFIMINNNKDSFISTFAFDPKSEHNQTHTSFYYQHPDLIKTARSLSMNENLNELEKERYIKHDIFSLGFLMYEIKTTKSLYKLLDNKSEQEKKDIINILFSENEYHYVNEVLNSGGFYGIIKIIKKCIDVENTYLSMNEILSDLDELPIYKTAENKEEIDYRIKNATNINEYECTFSDLVTNYYFGNQMSKVLITLSLNKICSQSNIKNKNVTNDSKDLISNIFEVLNFQNENNEI